MTRFILTFIFVVFLLFSLPFTSYCMQQSESQVLVNSNFFPYIYVKLINNNSNNFVSSVKVDEKEITNYEYTQFSIPKNKKIDSSFTYRKFQENG